MENQNFTQRTSKNLSELDETQISQVLSRGGTPLPDQSDSMTARMPLSLVKNVTLAGQFHF
ncbi:unnamed protein product [Callosobruchus maculatus]|uniref:Uncharacterized protein n=1 Tax=Callosobruchus maculatus TaxID=64391 RepID=A0A653DH18_CALMS|nr:unnamed protein product [Callosobruchus maculatus]